MSSRNPTYITKSRHGIWYFQYWVPNITNQNEKNVQKLIRRSLKTRNRRKALGLARKWWIVMIESDANPNSITDDLEQWEQDGEKKKFLYRLGAKVSHEMKELGVNPENPFELDSYFEGHPPQHEEAFFFFVDVQANTKYQSLSKNDPSNQGLSAKDMGDIVAAKIQEANFHEKNYSHEDNPRVEQLLERWLSEISVQMQKSSYPEYERMTKFFSQVVTELNGDKSPRIASLNKSMIREYKEVIKRLPKNSKTVGLGLKQISELQGKPKSPSTIRHIFANVGTFLRWVKNQTYPIDRDLIDLMKMSRPPKSSELKQRKPHGDLGLKKLFESKKYRQGKFNKACDYWAPLIALFTGAAQGEIVQLYVKDLKDIDGKFYFDINKNDDKKLKNEGGRPRVVPVHTQLVKLGLIEYAKYQEFLGNKRLFPAEKRNSRGTFGNYSHRFSTYRKSVGVKPSSLKEYRDFHAFRHLVRTRLGDAEVESLIADEIGGWTSEVRSIGERVYSHAERLPQKIEAIEALKYEIDFAVIRHWKHQAFMKQPEQLRDWDSD